MNSGDSEGYLVVPNELEIIERLHSPISSFASIRHPLSPTLSISPQPPTYSLVPYRNILSDILISLDQIFPASLRRFLNRYIIWPFFSGIISSFTQTIFTRKRNRF